MRKVMLFGFLLVLVPVVGFGMPHEECGAAKRECASCHTLSIQEAGALLKDLGEVKSVKMSPVQGLFELTLENEGQTAKAYMDFGKKFLVAGTIFDIATKKPVAGQQGEAPRPTSTIKTASIPLENSIVMGDPAAKKKLFVFTDPECPYCARLHHELVKLMYMEPDVAIYVKLFPLKIHPQAYDKARVILAGANPLFLLDKAFAGESLPPAGPGDSAKPVDDTIKLAASLGITATPTLVLPDGRVMTGFREAAEIKKLLSESEKNR